MKKSNIVCIYHANCQDGFTAAWAVREALGEENVEFIPGVYQKPPPDVTDKRVILVDFSYKRDVLMDMATKAEHITVLDHHKSAQGELGTINTQDLAEGDYCPMTIIFDMNKSGALLAWEYFFPDVIPPKALQHVSDRDLWKFELSHTREICAAIFSYPYDFKVWDDLMNPAHIAGLVTEGTAIERKHHKDVAELVAGLKRDMLIGDHWVPVANLPYVYTSDAGHLMSKDIDTFAACYWDTDTGRVFSLRSRKGGMDVSKVAEQYGGGGHANAAGFEVPQYHELAKA